MRMLFAAALLCIQSFTYGQTLDARTAKLEAELAKLQSEVALLLEKDTSTPTVPTVDLAERTLPDGRELVMIYTADCTYGRAALNSIAKYGLPVTVLKAEDDPIKAINYWRDCETEFACPGWVLLDDGEVIKRWIGTDGEKGADISAMVKFTPPSQEPRIVAANRTVAVTTTYNRGIPTQTVTQVPINYSQPQQTVYQRASVPPARRTWYHNGGGSLAQHLQSHGINPAGMSHQEMINAHSHAHEGTWGSVQRTYSQPVQLSVVQQPRFYSQPVRYMSSCPGGNCP